MLDTDAYAVSKNPALIKGNERALEAASKAMGMEPMMYGAMLDQMIAQNSAAADQMPEMQNKLMAGITAAAEALDMDAAGLATSMGKIKDSQKTMTTAVIASGLPQKMFIGIINQQLANDEIILDNGG